MSQPEDILSPLLESLYLSGCSPPGTQPSGYLLTQMNVYLLGLRVSGVDTHYLFLSFSLSVLSFSLLFSEHPLCQDLFCLPFGTKQYFTKCPLNILILLYHVTS